MFPFLIVVLPKGNPTGEVNAQHSKMLSHKVTPSLPFILSRHVCVAVLLCLFYSQILLYFMSGPHS